MTVAPASILPEALAQRQLDAYNAHDVDAFVACYTDDVEVFELPSMTRIVHGREALAARYAPYFASRRPRATLSSPRLTLSTMAIDSEAVVFADGSMMNAIALYHVDDGLIRRVWFIRS